MQGRQRSKRAGATGPAKVPQPVLLYSLRFHVSLPHLDSVQLVALVDLYINRHTVTF